MKLLINLLAHDGIVSHYTGVGTMVKRYTRAIDRYASSNINSNKITLNLISPKYLGDSFGYSADTHYESKRLAEKNNGKVLLVDNGSDGSVNYGKLEHWQLLCQNAGKVISSLELSSYDLVLNIYNDTPFACLAKFLPVSRSKSVWIPHSTVRIHKEDSALTEDDSEYFKKRDEWEKEASRIINKINGAYLGYIGHFISKHMVQEYGVTESKLIPLINGIDLDEEQKIDSNSRNLNGYMERIDSNKTLIFSFGRAERYKNLDYTLKLGSFFDSDFFQTVVIAQSYYPTQPILDEYRQTQQDYNPKAELFIDPPFKLAQAILNLNQPKIVIVPSYAETMGLIINEVRSTGHGSNLLAANNVAGLKEQVKDGFDGVLIDCDDTFMKTKKKILQYNSLQKRKNLSDNGVLTINNKYNINTNITNFLNKLIEGNSYQSSK